MRMATPNKATELFRKFGLTPTVVVDKIVSITYYNEDQEYEVR